MSKVVSGLTIVTLFISLFVLACDISADVSNNPIVPNSGFEKKLARWKTVDYEGSKHRLEMSSKSHQGGASLRILKENVEGFVQLQSTPCVVNPQTRYRVGAWVNIPESASSFAKIYFVVRQFKKGASQADPPNTFSPVRPIYATGGKWERQSLEITTREQIDRLQINLVVAEDKSDVLMDDFYVEALGSSAEYKPRYEPRVPEALSTPDEAEAVLKSRPRATASVRTAGGRPRLFIDGKESFPGFYVGSAWKGSLSRIGDFQDAGVRVFLIPYVLGRGLYGDLGAWQGKNQIDFSEVDAMLWRVLRADPNAYILFYLATDPYPEWGTKNPESIVRDQFGNKAIVDMHFLRWGGEPRKSSTSKVERFGVSYVSEALRRDTSSVLREFDRHIKQSLPGKAVIGYHVVGGNDGQMFQWGDFGTDHFSDYSRASLLGFQKWLRLQYKTEVDLQKAWGKAKVTFATASIPAAQHRGVDRLFLDRPGDQDIVDFNRFRSEGIVDTLNVYAKVLRESHQTPIVLGTYYAGPTSLVASHRATGYLLQKGLYNYLTSVPSYGDVRRPGGPGKAHQAWSSLILHNMFGLAEEDFRSWKTSYTSPETDYWEGRVESAEESNAMIRRDTGHMLALGQGNWWYDMSGGSFGDPSIMRAVNESVRGYRQDLKTNDLPRADVAVFVDEQSLNYIASAKANPLFRYSLDEQIVAFNSSGVPYHLYLQEDIANKKLPSYKLYVFLNAYHMTCGQWAAIQKLRSGGKMLAFMHAPGAMSRDSLQVDNKEKAVSKVTGIQVRAQTEQKMQLKLVQNSPLQSARITGGAPLTLENFRIEDAAVKPIALYPNGTVAVGLRDFGTWKSLFYGGVGMSPSFFNALARQQGAWVAAPAGNAVYGSQHFLTIHALYPGEKTIQLMRASKLTDLITGTDKNVGRTFQLSMKRGETRWFYVE